MLDCNILHIVPDFLSAGVELGPIGVLGPGKLTMFPVSSLTLLSEILQTTRLTMSAKEYRKCSQDSDSLSMSHPNRDSCHTAGGRHF
jgi:hypothetical protein